MTAALSDAQRKRIHDFALEARELLVREARELLEGVYGLRADATLTPPDRLPQVRDDPETAETYRRLGQFLHDEARAGIPRAEAVEKLVKEVAFTHLNRMVAFKMMEARKLIRGTVDKGPDSNAFKFYLADPAHAEDLKLHREGDTDTAYRHFLLWQAAQVAQELKVLFDPDTLASRLFPRPRALRDLLAMLNDPEIAPAWQADETIGWVYQYFNERERDEWGQRRQEKIPAHIVPVKTQLYTPDWVVQVLVQNTLGRLWVEMHPDTRLLGSHLLDYLVPPLPGPQASVANPKLCKDITLLDPACGTMHFGLVAFDLFAAMYQEELERAGEPGWPDTPSVQDPADIPAAILANNLFGIDIDLRAVQLSALALYLKAKSLNPRARVAESHLACADVLPLDGARLGTFLREANFQRPIYERLIRRLWERLRQASDVGSLLRLEREIEDLVAQEKARHAREPLFDWREMTEEEAWDLLSAQLIQGLDEFARQQASAGVDQTFFTGEAVKGLRLVDLMLRRYDVVVTNPPYLDSRDYNENLKRLLEEDYPDSKRNLYSAFTERCLELVADGGRVGILTGQSFMFISSFQRIRERILSEAVIEMLLQFDYHLFPDARMDTACYVLRADPDAARRENSVGTYFRLVHAPDGDAKRVAFEQALRSLRAADSAEPARDPAAAASSWRPAPSVYRVPQRRFDAIPGSPWVYWITDSIRALFETLPSLGDVAQPVVGLQTGENERFLRYWWEVGVGRIGFGCRDRDEARATGKTWFPYMKGGAYRKWYGNQEHVVNWWNDGEEIRCHPSTTAAPSPENTRKNEQAFFREGVTWSDLSSTGFGVRYLPPGFVFDVKGSSGFPCTDLIPVVLALMNSPWMSFALGLLNPTVSFQVGDISRVPFREPDASLQALLVRSTRSAIQLRLSQASSDETTYDFIAPPRWDTGLEEMAAARARLAALEAQIDEEVYHLYGISDEDRAAIEAELRGGSDDSHGDAENTEELEQDSDNLRALRASVADRSHGDTEDTEQSSEKDLRALRASVANHGHRGTENTEELEQDSDNLRALRASVANHSHGDAENTEELEQDSDNLRALRASVANHSHGDAENTEELEQDSDNLRALRASVANHGHRGTEQFNQESENLRALRASVANEDEAPMSREELAVRWISYAVGIVLGRFAVGGSPLTKDDPPSRVANRQPPIGSAVYRREDFAIGSLPAPDEAEFNELVGPPERFAYVDERGGRHLFSAETEAALRGMALADGIAVLDEGHPRDLPALVLKALELMLGERAAQDVIGIGASGDLRAFLSRDFFTRWHFKWYRKRPVYWPLQSAKRAYGFVLFHERINQATLYILMREYLDYKINGLNLRLADLKPVRDALEVLTTLTGSERRRLERMLEAITATRDEIAEFAKTMDRIVREGYEPAPDWIDDGIILRMAPLWELVPLWSSEPKKHWERLKKGEFDWSHIAMHYWPNRVKEKCKTDRSLAIAHGLA